jgi:uncharacterized protein YfcZ (UPF0381/DUF406 family)
MSQDKNNTNECTVDVCDTCGSIVELGSVITADDTVLVLPFTGADKAAVELLAKKYIDAAKERFPEVIVNTEESSDSEGEHIELTLTFDCTAEKLIFEMGLSAIK